jgi:endoglucanase
MKKILKILFASLIIGIMVFGCTVPGSPSYKSNKKNSTFNQTRKRSLPGPVKDYGILQVKDGKLCDKDGNPVQLRGMSLYWSMWGQQWWNESAIDQAVDFLGCQIIRAPLGIGDADNPIKVGGYLDGEVNKALNKARVERVVEQAIYRGIYVIIDWHDSHAEDHTAAAEDFFRQMASKYKDTPNVIFEIYNEPVSAWSAIKKYAEAVIKVIRDQGANNLIIVGTPDWSKLGQEVIDNKINATNIAYTLHFYAGAPSHYLDSGLGRNAKDAVEAGLCVFVTEWGTCYYDGNGDVDPIHSQEWIDWMKENKISWCNWALNDMEESASIFKVNTNPYGPWSDSDLTDSGKYLLYGTGGKEPPLPAPTASFVVSPSLLRLKGNGKEAERTTVIKGSLSGATTDQDWLHVQTSGQTITVSADVNDSDTNDRFGNIILSDGNGHEAKIKVIQLRNDGNLALMQPAYASSQEGSYKAINAVDGDETGTRWGSKFTNNQRIPSEDFQWIVVDLGKDRSFGKIVLFWEAAYASRYLIETAPDQGSNDLPDNSKFSELYDSGMIPDGKGNHSDTLNTGRTARWVRVRSLARTYIGGKQFGVSLYEIKLFKVPYIAAWGPDKTQFPNGVYAGGYEVSDYTISNVSWTASSDSDWLTVSPTTGGSDEDPPPNDGVHGVKYTVAPNYTGKERTGHLTFTGNGVTKTISFTQAAETNVYHTKDTSGNPVDMHLYASLTSTVTNPDESMDFDISVNRYFNNWQTILVDNPDWLTIKSYIPPGDNVPSWNTTGIRLHATPNMTAAERKTLVVFTMKPSPCLTFLWINQSPTQPTITTDPSSWSIGPGANPNLSTTVTSNTAWTVTDKPDWITISPSSGAVGTQSVTVNVAANTDPDYREGSVKFTCNNSNISTTIRIIQGGEPPQQNKWTPSGGGDQQNYTITWTGNWTASSSVPGWLTITPTNGYGNGSIYMSANANTTGVTRTATVTITGNGATKTIQITQDPVSLTVSPASISVGANGGTKSFAITSNTIWWSAYTTDGGGWLSINTGSYSGSGNGTVYFTLSKNTTGKTRTATITVISGNVPNKIVTITQAAN